jgi:ribosome modulation factor
MTIPTNDQVRLWEIAYKTRYQTQHRAQSRALLDLVTDLATNPLDEVREITGRADHVLAQLEAEEAAALSLVDDDQHLRIAFARGEGFGARRNGKAQTECPEDLTVDERMAWHAGWSQADPDLKLPRSRGYTPPETHRSSE